MEPCRLRSQGLQRSLMIPDVFKRGGPRVQEQTFGPAQATQREAVDVLQNTTAITEREAEEIRNRINKPNQINIATMGLTASEAMRVKFEKSEQSLRSPSQSIGPSRQTSTNPMNKPANRLKVAEVKTITQEPMDKAHRNAARRVRSNRKSQSSKRMKGRTTNRTN